MRTTATFTVTATPFVAREVLVEFLEGEGVPGKVDEDWDGTPLWPSCAVRFDLAAGGQDYAFEVHIREYADDKGDGHTLIEVRQDARGFGTATTAPRWSEVQLEHLDDALRDALARRGVLEHVEQFS